MKEDQPETQGVRPQRGRPAATQPFKQLVIELNRLTSCADNRLAKRIERVRKAGGLPGLAALSESTIQRMLTAANLGSANRPSGGETKLPGWCAVHVAPVNLGPAKGADMAFMFEPFSGALFGEVRTTFDGVLPEEVSGREDEPELAAFVRRSLERLPRALASRITSIRLTAPNPQAGLATWYSKGVVAGTVDPIPREGSRPMMPCETDGPTSLYGALDLHGLFGISQIAQANAYLACALDAHNLAQENESFRGLRPYVVDQPWDTDGGPTFQRDFMRGRPVGWPPETRLDVAVPIHSAARQTARSSIQSEMDGGGRETNATPRRRLQYGFAPPELAQIGGDRKGKPNTGADPV